MTSQAISSEWARRKPAIAALLALVTLVTALGLGLEGGVFVTTSPLPSRRGLG